MDSSVALVVGLLIGLLVGGVVGGAIVGMRAARSAGALAVARADLDTMRAQQGTAVALVDLLEPVRDSLERLRSTAEQAGRERAAAEATLTTQIEAVQQRYASLEQTTAQLAAALARGQTRGQWGEMQLEGLLEHAGLLEGVHYTRQDVRTGEGGGTRPDIVVHLPGGGEVLVDAKFPFDAYWEALGCTDAAARDVLLRKHAADVLLRARELSSKRYADSTSSPDFVVMFLPLESLLSASLEVDGLLLEKTFERKVVLATPTTMLALLRTIAFGYQRQLMADNAEQIREAGAEMLTRLGVLVEHLDVMRRGLDQAVKGYNSFVGSFDRQAMRQARRLSELGVPASRGLTAPDELDVALRESDPRALREIS